MRFHDRALSALLTSAVWLPVALWWTGSAAGAAEPPSKAPAEVSVLDEACVDRRVDMCLRLADADTSIAVESTEERLCTSPGCERGWYRTELGQFGLLGPLCVCERRKLVVGDGQRCAEGFQQTTVTGKGGIAQAACELPDLRMAHDQARWVWPTTPWDLMTCLQFARFGPGSSSCRRTIRAVDH